MHAVYRFQCYSQLAHPLLPLRVSTSPCSMSDVISLYNSLVNSPKTPSCFISSLISSIFFFSVASVPAPVGRLFTFCLLESFGHFSGAFPSLQSRLIHLSGTPVYFPLSPSAHPPSPKHQPNGSSFKNSVNGMLLSPGAPAALCEPRLSPG